jgi:chemotaxis signal transduction protein
MYFSRMGLKPGVVGNDAVNVLFDVVPPVGMPNFLAENPESCGFMVAEPIGSKAIAKGIAEPQLLSSELWNLHPCCVVIFRNEFIEKYSDAVQEFTNLLVDAGKFIRMHPEKSAEIAVDFLDPEGKLGLQVNLLKKVLTDPKGIKTDNLYPAKEDLDVIQRYMTEKMGIGRMIDLDQFVDARFADIACKEQLQRPDDKLNRAMAASRQAILSSRNSHRDREGMYLTVKLGSEFYGISILDVREIVEMMPITRVPQMPEYGVGVITLRDTVISVVDLRVKLGMEQVEPTEFTCIVIVEISGVEGSVTMGVVVDTVQEVATFQEEDIRSAPKIDELENSDFIIGMAQKHKKFIMLIDVDLILNSDEVINIGEAEF